MQEKEIGEEEKLIIFNKAYGELRNFIIKSVVEYDKIKEKENEEGLNLGDLAELDYTKLLPYEMNLRTIKIGKREIKYIIYIKSYPLYFDDFATSKKMNMISSLKKIIMGIFEKEEYSFIKIEFPVLSDNESSLSEDIKTKTNDNYVFFRFKTDNPKPESFSFVPNRDFLNFCRENLHPKYSLLFDEFHKYNDVQVNVICKNGYITHYENELMNEALMYLVNKFNKKSCSVLEFKISDVINKLILSGSPEIQNTGDNENSEQGERVEIDSVFTNKIFIKNFEKHKLNKGINGLIEYICNNINTLKYYNFNKYITNDCIKFDENRKAMLSMINFYSDFSKTHLEDLFTDFNDHTRADLLKMLLLVFSDYYDKYHTMKIDDKLFDVVKEKQKKTARKNEL